MNARELSLRATIPLVINSFNQLYYLRNMIERFRAQRFRNIIVVDNGSTYTPLLAYLEQLNASGDALVVYYGANRGPHHFFLHKLHNQLFEQTPFLYSDPDIELAEIAPDLLSRWFAISHRYREYKVGCALIIPSDAEMKPGLVFRSAAEGVHTLAGWEAQFWQNAVEPDVYMANIDTTLHLFNPAYYPPGGPLVAGMRVAGIGHAARHLPWFRDDRCPADDAEHYQRLARYSNWGGT